MFSKFKIEKAPNVLYRRGPRHFEVEQSAISLPLLEAYDQRIRHLRAENEQLRAEKMEDVKIINGQAAELAERRAEVFQLRQELQLLLFIAKFSWVITQYDIDLSLFIPFTLSAKNLCESI